LTDQHIYAFSGGDTVLPLMGNVLGGANIFMKRQVFEALGGFTTYKSVGFEDYEFLVKVKLNGYNHTVVPDPILFVRNTEGSMMKRDDHFNGDLRVLSNYMDKEEFKDFNDLFLLTKGGFVCFFC
jgi:GT2 family glycosyltransferase